LYLFADILLLLSVLNVLGSIVTGEIPAFALALCVFFTLYLMGTNTEEEPECTMKQKHSKSLLK
jgi:hypothetical protein